LKGHIRTAKTNRFDLNPLFDAFLKAATEQNAKKAATTEKAQARFIALHCVRNDTVPPVGGKLSARWHIRKERSRRGGMPQIIQPDRWQSRCRQDPQEVLLSDVALIERATAESPPRRLA
jgi:hypothetical protein